MDKQHMTESVWGLGECLIIWLQKGRSSAPTGPGEATPAPLRSFLRLREAKRGAAPAGFISDSQEQRAVLKQSLPLSSLHLSLQWGYHMEKMDDGVL